MNYFLSDGSILEKVNQGELYITENKAAAIGVEIGDKLTIELNGINCELIFKGKIKDALFGSNQVTITRYIISVEDYNALTSAENAEEFYGGSLVYIHSSDIDTLVKQIKPLADNSFLTFDRASMEFCYIFDMIIVGLLIVVSVIFIAVAFVVLRFTITFTLSDEFREIGVMKAIGIGNFKIRGLYLVKYLGLSLIHI